MQLALRVLQRGARVTQRQALRSSKAEFSASPTGSLP
jgi:hypothetical protein